MAESSPTLMRIVRRPRTVSKRLRDISHLLVRNFDGAIQARDLAAFGIPDNRAHQIGSGFDIEMRSDRNARLKVFFQGAVVHTQLHRLFLAADHVAIPIKQHRHKG